MASKKLNVAVIGAGAMGLEHIRNFKLIENAAVVCVVDSNLRSRREAEEILDETAEIIGDYRDILKCKHRIDAIVLATPNFSHIGILREIIPWRLHLLVEKPLCTTVEDCLEVQELLSQHSVGPISSLEGDTLGKLSRESSSLTRPGGSPPMFWVGMEYRYMPPVTKLLSVVDSGALGRVHMVHMREHRFPFLLKVADWNRFSQNTGGTLVEKCCHFWDLMRRVVGPSASATRVFASGAMDVNHVDESYPVRREEGIEHEDDEDSSSSSGAVAASGASSTGGGGSVGGGRRPDIIDNAFVIVEFDGGVRACLDLCMFAEDRQHEELIVVGSQGKVTAEAPACVVTHHTPTQRASGPAPSNQRVPPPPGAFEKNTVVTTTHVDEALLQAGYHEGATFFELKAFVDAVVGGAAAPAVTCEDGLAAVAIGVAAERSIKLQREVLVADVMAEARTTWSTRLQERQKQGSSNGESDAKRQKKGE